MRKMLSMGLLFVSLNFQCHGAEWVKKWFSQGRDKIFQKNNEEPLLPARVVINQIPVVETPEPSSSSRHLMSLRRMSHEAYYSYLNKHQVVVLGQEDVAGDEHEEEIIVAENNGIIEFIEVTDTAGKKHILADECMHVKYYHSDIVSYRPVVQEELKLLAALYGVDLRKECHDYRIAHPETSLQEAMEYVQKEESARLQRLAQHKKILPETIELVEQKKLIKLPNVHQRVILRQRQEEALFEYAKRSLEKRFQFLKVQ